MSLKIKEFLNKHFYRVFNESHLFYTLIYLLSAFFMAFLSFIRNTGNIILFFATTISLTFIILLFIATIPNMKGFLFSEEQLVDQGKILSFLSIFIFCCIIMAIYFIFGGSKDLTIQFLGWDILLPTMFVFIFFGWNISQIWFLRYYMEDFASKVEEKIISPEMKRKNRERFSLIFLIIALIFPVILNIISISYFSIAFGNESTETIATLIIIIILIFIVIGLTSIRQIILYIKSKENDSPNVFSSVFYIFIWLYIWYRSFSFINAFSSASQTTADILTTLIDVILMIAVAISVLRSLGGKIRGIQLFNQYNIAFFLYAFTLLYIEGQVIMITGAGALKGVFSDTPQISLVNNFIILVVSVVFYAYYSSYILQRKDFINKTHFKPSEVIKILSEYRKHLDSRGYINLTEIDDREFEMFIESQNLKKEESEPKKAIKTETLDRDVEIERESEEILEKNNDGGFPRDYEKEKDDTSHNDE
ncbi:MAG: hypothetical protein EU541_03320 [Promethearchaeota archaeon]|nr:MAG: hypothetical protein EU541_03320 [Candidatus Lokiarchaeota archaeon]